MARKPAIIKFREIVAKNFLSHTLEEISNMELNKFDIGLITKMSNFKQTLDDFFPGDKNNIGTKMQE